jgi:hypothetical protein
MSRDVNRIDVFAGVVPRIGHDPLLANTFQFVINLSYINFAAIYLATESIVNITAEKELSRYTYISYPVHFYVFVSEVVSFREISIKFRYSSRFVPQALHICYARVYLHY